MSIPRPKRLGTLVATTAAVALACAAASAAAIVDQSGVIHGCYSNSTGALRVIDTATGANCARKTSRLDWNQTGPRGPAGTNGAPGPQGPAGPQGPSGTTAWAVVSASGTLARGNGVASVNRTSTGTYVVTTTTADVTGCVFLGTGGDTGTGSGALTTNQPGPADSGHSRRTCSADRPPCRSSPRSNARNTSTTRTTSSADAAEPEAQPPGQPRPASPDGYPCNGRRATLYPEEPSAAPVCL